jgi:lycopene beta-cyclase
MYRYKMLRGIDFYRCAHQRLAAYPNVEFLRGRVDQIWGGDSHARVVVDGQAYAARWVFDSLFTWTAPSPSPHGLARIPRCGGFHSITQQFQGWEIEAANAAFDPHVASLMDFRTPQAQGLCFLYVLPLTARRAIVEHVQCATAFAQRTARNDAMNAYLRDVLGVADYHIVREEHGFSPLTDRPFCRGAGRHVMTIGIKGGQIKPSTGYAFMRMQDDAAAIVQSLLERGHPFHVPRSPRRYRYFDAVLLDILAHRPEQAVPIFTALFRRSPPEQVFRFLDEETSVWENLQMIPTMPPRLLLQAVLDLCHIAHV